MQGAKIGHLTCYGKHFPRQMRVLNPKSLHWRNETASQGILFSRGIVSNVCETMKRSTYAFFLIYALGALAYGLFHHEKATVVQLLTSMALCLGLTIALIDEQKGIAVLIGALSVIVAILLLGFLFGAQFLDPWGAIIFITAILSGLIKRWRTLRALNYF
jgi:hypothetical protein